MNSSEYTATVEKTDRTVGRGTETRARILRYGLVGEIGSVVAAVKKRLLSIEGVERRSGSTDEVAEELGDVLWYCFALDHVLRPGAVANLLACDTSARREELTSQDARAQAIATQLGEHVRARFLHAADKLTSEYQADFDAYQDAAILTARTKGEELIEVCLAVLTQLGAELLRRHLPPIEIELNRQLPDRPVVIVLGEIVWHVAVLASSYDLRLCDIAARNADKLSWRLDRSQGTPLHDAAAPPLAQLPRYFVIDVVALGPGRSRMLWDGEPLGDDLTDNARDEDGYRFHDAMHIAHAAKLGWSPVLRALMRRKRKHDAIADEVEDGARARIVEEALVKLVHSEAVRSARERGVRTGALVSDRGEISYSLLKQVRHLVSGLEVARNRDWEWEDAILAGQRLFAALREHQRGRITVDLNQRSITFDPGEGGIADRFMV